MSSKPNLFNEPMLKVQVQYALYKGVKRGILYLKLKRYIAYDPSKIHVLYYANG